MDFAAVDAENLQFGRESFDRVTSRLGVMYFVDVQRALAGIKRVLVPEGIVTLQVWDPPDESPYSMSALIGPSARISSSTRDASSAVLDSSGSCLSEALSASTVNGSSDGMQQRKQGLVLYIATSWADQGFLDSGSASPLAAPRYHGASASRRSGDLPT